MKECGAWCQTEGFRGEALVGHRHLTPRQKSLHRLASCLVSAGKWRASGNQPWALHFEREAASIRRGLAAGRKPKERRPEAFTCRACGDLFDVRVWHCPHCEHHWPASRRSCWNCHRRRVVV